MCPKHSMPDAVGQIDSESARKIQAFRDATGVTADIRPVAWAPGYFACADGFVLSLRTWRRQIAIEWRVLKTMRHSGGYPQVNLRVENRSNIRRVHNLIAEVFLGPVPFPNAEVRHLDGDPENNAVTNLAYGTHAENMADTARHGTRPSGERNGHAKLRESDIRPIRSLWQLGVPLPILSRAYGVTVSTVGNVIHRDTWESVE